jgi:hypothetical protein
MNLPETTAVASVPCCDEDEHDWRWVSDWYGDPGVINGTADCSRYVCTICGAEKGGDPPQDDYDPMEWLSE